MLLVKKEINIKPNWWLISSILVILSIGGLIYWQSKPKQEKQPELYWETPEINNFCINKACFDKTGDKWLMMMDNIKYPANKDLIEYMLPKLKQVRLEEVVSVNVNNFGLFGIDFNSPTMVMINNKVLYIGNIDYSRDGTIVTDANKLKLYVTRATLDKTLLSKTETWTNKIVTNWQPDQIKSIQAIRGKYTKELIGKYNSKAITQVIQLKAEAYLPNFATSRVTHSFKIETGDNTYSLKIGIKLEKLKLPVYWATIDDADYYQINKIDYQKLTAIIK